MNLYPAILSDSIETVQKQIKLADSINGIKTIQIDVIDGYFADNVTVTPLDLIEIDFGDLSVDLHLMTEEPLDYVYEFLERKEEIPVRMILGQIEKMSYQRFFLEEVKKHGWKAGLSLDVFTPLDEIDEEVWEILDAVQLVGVEIGFQGGEFNQQTYQKIQNLRKKNDQIEIIADGGVKLDNLDKIFEAGADSVAVGSAIWTSPQPQKVIQELLNFTAK